jgi:ligand-binding sensor domain-containing protein/signal transduction histidine kinase
VACIDQRVAWAPTAILLGATLWSVPTVEAQPIEASRAASASYSRRIWQSQDGLPEDFAQAIAQTADGHLWIGTSGGLVRFDGVRFTVFNPANEPAFKSDSVYSLQTTRDGALWAGTEGAGLVRYRQGSFRAFGPPDGLTNPFVRVMFEDRRGRLWVGTDDGLFRLDGEAFQRIDGRGGAPQMHVHAIAEDRNGRMLVGGGGLIVLDGDRVEHYRSSETLADNSIRTIRESRDGSVWMGTVTGLRRLDGGVRGNPFLSPRVLDRINISMLYEGPSGQMWIATYGRGLMRHDKGAFVTLNAPAFLPHDNVLAVFEDAESNVWIGTHGGLLRLRRSDAQTITTADGAPSSINTIYEDRDGSLLVAALNGRLFKVERQTLVPVDLAERLESLRIRNVFRDSKGRFWFGTDGQGVARMDPPPHSASARSRRSPFGAKADGGAIVRYTMKDGLGNDFIRAFAEDAEGGIWIGTDGGVSYLQSGEFRNFKRSTGLVYSSIRVLVLDRTGTLWVATDGGVSRIRAGTFVTDGHLDRLRGHRVWALHEDKDGGMWIGTQGAGVFLFKDAALTQFTMAHGLPSNKIHFIGEDAEGSLWMSGPTGVVSVPRADLEKMRDGPPRHVPVRVYGTPEGLNTNQMTGGVQTAGVVTATGDIWLPSTKGAVHVVPERPERRPPISLLVEQVIADGRQIAPSPDVNLPLGDGKLEIHYTSIRLGAPERLRFKYWMEGFEREWTLAGQRRVAYYTNMPHGTYKFHVAAYDMNAPHNEVVKVMTIGLRPPFYRTEWFVALCIVALAATTWGVYWLHVRSIRRQFAAVLEERGRVAREMHDTLIQGCVGVSTLLEAASHAKEISPNLSGELLDRARSEVRAAVDEARLAVWNLRRGSPNGDRLVPAVAQLARRVSLESGIDIRVNVDGQPVALGSTTEESLTMLIREALLNAIRHASPTRLTVSLSFDRRRLHVAIEDDGLGFDSKAGVPESSLHYGLVGMRERVDKLDGEFQLTSSPGTGTRVRVSIPLPRTAPSRQSRQPA